MSKPLWQMGPLCAGYDARSYAPLLAGWATYEARNYQHVVIDTERPAKAKARRGGASLLSVRGAPSGDVGGAIVGGFSNLTSESDNPGNDVSIHCVRPAVLRQMEQRIAPHQGDVSSAGAVDITSFAAGHKSLWSDCVRRLTGAGEFSLRQLTRVVAR